MPIRKLSAAELPLHPLTMFTITPFVGDLYRVAVDIICVVVGGVDVGVGVGDGLDRV